MMPYPPPKQRYAKKPPYSYKTNLLDQEKLGHVAVVVFGQMAPEVRSVCMCVCVCVCLGVPFVS